MTPLEKFRYLGAAQTARKYLLKFERAVKAAGLKPPAPPPADAFEFRVQLLGHEFDLRWHYSPDTGKSWPLDYGPAIPLEGGDVKLVWELNRHQFLPTLDPNVVRRILRDWVRQNPSPFGINWHSAMEVGLRLIAWHETFEQAPQLRDEFLPVLAQHARFVRHHLSADWIPRNNHLIGEAAALAVSGAQSPWLAQAATEQFYPSGVNREQSIAYHRFVTHLFAIAGLPQAKALAYLAAIRQPDGSLPDVGDNDDGLASSKPLVIPPAPANSVAFPDAGHYVIRHAGDYCFVRCGEFGLPPHCAHAHADLLSPVMWLRGEPVLADCGTFTYNGDPAQRRYFRSAHAHNVVTMDDQDYAEQAGTFGWKNPSSGKCMAVSNAEFIGEAGILRRRIRYATGAFTISDTVAGSGTHRLRWRFHLHPRWKSVRCDGARFQFGDFTLGVRAPTGAHLAVGQGWRSPGYHRRESIAVCEIAVDTTLPATAEFVLQ